MAFTRIGAPLAAAGMSLSLIAAVIAGGQATPPAVAPETGTIAGRVVAGDGTVLSGLRVVARIQGIGPVHEATVGIDDKFRIVVRAGRYVVQCSENGFDYLRRSGVQVRVGEVTMLDLSPSIPVTCECVYPAPVRFTTPVPAPATIRGQVADQKGNPIPLAEISLLGGGYFDEYLTDVKGQFTATVPSNRSYTIKGGYPGFKEAIVDLRLSPRESRSVPVILTPHDGDAAQASTRRWGFGCRCGQGAFNHAFDR